MDLLEIVKGELLRSNADQRHPFRFFYLATQAAFPEIRTVVKRDFSYEDWSVVFFTDARSPKVKQIQNQEKISALFYHPEKQVQLRMKGKAQLIGPEEEMYKSYLKKVIESPAAGDYSSVYPPGTAIDELSDLSLTDEIHFLAIRIQPAYLDILQLGKEQHTRMGYERIDGAWRAKRLVP